MADAARGTAVIEALLISLLAAPHPSYGGRLEWAGSGALTLCRHEQAESLVASSLVFEPLVAADGEPVLARALRIEEKRLLVLLRSDVEAHDGEALDAVFVARALRRGAKACGLAPFLDGRPEDAIVPDPLLASVRIDLRAMPRDPAAWLSAAPIALRRDGAWVGTGPFRWVDGQLIAFEGHRRGRPFLDELAFSAAGAPFESDPEGPLRVDWYLRVVDGDRSLTAALRQAVPNRALLSFLPGASMPIPLEPPDSAPTSVEGTWRLAQTSALPEAFLSRLQLDLSRRKVMLKLTRARRPAPDLEFMPVWTFGDAGETERRLAALRAAEKLDSVVLARLLEAEAPPWPEAFARSGLVPVATWRARPSAGPADPRRLPDWDPE